MTHWPQITVILMSAMNFGFTMSRLGQPKKDTYDWIDLILGPTVTYIILYFGGFFAPIGWGP